MFTTLMKTSVSKVSSSTKQAFSSSSRRVFAAVSASNKTESVPSTSAPTPLNIKSITHEQYASLDVVDRVRVVYELHGSKAIQMASMQRTSGVLMHLIHRAKVPLPILFIDTGFLHQETLDLRDEFINRYDLNIITLKPEQTVQEQEDNVGKDLWSTREGQVKCCYLRKEKPLHAALDSMEVNAKLSGMMQSQGGARANVQGVSEEPGTGTMLYNPLFDWTNKMIHEYNKEHNVPVHDLYNQSYKSIGCKPCTTPVKEGEDARAGRWRHLRSEGDSTHLYCGLNKTDVSPQKALEREQAKAAARAKREERDAKIVAEGGAAPKKKVRVSYLAKKKAKPATV